MKTQSELIGSHPTANHFNKWLIANDLDVTATKRHRQLTEHPERNDDDMIAWMAEKIIKHHYSEFRLERLKNMYNKLGFQVYAEQNKMLPIVDKVKKGNATEIILSEYIEGCLGKNLIKVFKLRYNPNVNQSIKGDDNLMIEQIILNNKKSIRIFLGESKFRSTPDKSVVVDISDSLTKDKMPLSYSFLVQEVAKEDKELAIHLDEFILQDIKNDGNMVYAGLLLSNTDSSKYVEKHLANDNPDMVFISIGMDNPVKLINEAFLKAEDMILNKQII